MGRYPWTEVFLLELLRILVFYPTRHRVYRLLILAAMIYLAAQIYLTPEVTDPLSITYTVGGTIPLAFAYAAHVLYGQGPFPDHWRRVRDEVHAEADADRLDNLPSNFSFVKKLWWMLDLAYSIRMIGWVQEPRDSLPSRPPPSRQTFFWKTFLKLIVNLAIVDLTTIVFAQSPAFDSRVHDPSDGPETYLAAVPLPHRAPYILALALMMACGFSAVHNLMALTCVGIGRSSPTLWPDIGGRWEDSYTLRKFWGRTWHQRMRLTVAGLGKLVANKTLKFPRGTKRSSYVQLYLAFFLSGIFHFAGDFMYEKRFVSRSFKFFLLQAVAITFEDFVLSLAKRYLPQSGIESKLRDAGWSWLEVVVRVVGYCWVILWFCLTVPVWMDESSAAGFGIANRGPIAQFLMDTWKKRV
ncbi:membrane bound O-acyl transferase family-domain-containing protein [Thelephora terrestris]|uniref:Membrane bound O-acyl transferase family-domain-containing protein n=1 Tax=Thelephora terrestris TaxID=56493 RepID=A0A9P6H299_9AGAM|nr:membrane bound O-acyl transferase family-domain-containing protein [Thelephora terrestris]